MVRYTAGTISGDIYEAQNGKGIGDIEDLCVYGSKLYAIGSTSSKIDILDRNGKLLKSLPMTNEEGKPIEPRRAVGAEGCVFFTAYDGTVSKLDTLTQTVTAKVEVGAYPEALAYTDGKLYINLSGYGKGNQVAVVNTATMTKTKDIEVKLNPSYQCLRGDDGAIYVVSFGNYAGKPGLLKATTSIRLFSALIRQPIRWKISVRLLTLPTRVTRCISCIQNIICRKHAAASFTIWKPKKRKHLLTSATFLHRTVLPLTL